MESTLLRSVYKLQDRWISFLRSGEAQCTSNGKYICCMCPDRVNLMDIENGAKIVWKIELEDDEILEMLLTADDAMLILALKSGSLSIYDCSNLAEEPSKIGNFKSFHPGPITSLAVFTRLLATGCSNGIVRVWDLQKKFCTHKMENHAVVSTIMFDDDICSRPWLYVVAYNHIYIWLLNAGSSELVAKLTDHYSKVTSIQLHHDHKHLVSCGHDKVIIIWNLETFKAENIVPVYESISAMVLKPKAIQFPKVSEDIENINALVMGDKGFLSVWNVTKGRREWVADEKVVNMPDAGGVSVVSKMQFVPSLDSVVLTTYENSIMFLQCQTMDIWKQLAGDHDQILDLIFCGEGDTHLVVATNSGRIGLFNIMSSNFFMVSGHKSSVMSLSCHPTVKQIFGSSSTDNTARLWQLNGGSPICIFIAVSHTHSVTSISLWENYFITVSKDNCIKSWKLPKDISKLNENNVKVTLSNSARAHTSDINCVCVARNGKIIATGSDDKTVKIWDSNLCEIGILRGHKNAIYCVMFSPIDKIVATGSSDKTIKLWSLSDFSIIKSFEEHTKAVLQMSWISNGKQILSTGADGLLKLWSVKEGVCTNTLEGHDGEVWALALSDRNVVTGGEDSTIYWWKDVTEEEELEKQKQLDSMAQNEQELQNLLRSKKWRKALVLSIRLNQPYRTLSVIGDLIVESSAAVPEVLNQLDNDDLASILEYAQSWITQTRNLTVARAVLNFFMTERTPEELEDIRGCKKAIAGLLPYTERHAKRTAAHMLSSQIFDFVLYELSLK